MHNADPRQSAALCYVHIQKNAGNAVRGWLDEVFGPDLVEIMAQGRRVGGRARTWSTSPDELAVVRHHTETPGPVAVAANLPIGLHEHVRRPVRYVTFLREPLSRSRSFWYHAYRLRHVGNAWQVIEDCERDPRTAVQRGLIQLSNEQTRFLSGADRLELTRDDLRRAQEALQERIDFVGTTSDLQEVLDRVAAAYGRRSATVGLINQGEPCDSSLLPPSAEQRFTELNDLDLELWDWFVTQHRTGVSS